MIRPQEALDMIIDRQEDVTRAVLAELARAPDARFRAILAAAVRHLHAFVREARLTEAEFHQACGVIARLGQATTDSHNDAASEPAPDADVRGPWYSLAHHFVLDPGEPRLPKPPITGKAQGERPQWVVIGRS